MNAQFIEETLKTPVGYECGHDMSLDEIVNCQRFYDEVMLYGFLHGPGLGRGNRRHPRRQGG
ncbi:hypothetical protein AGMMS50268_40010 [Spirochaetia bacterium]|nr:hypothetical protein AGMMS50268_40010 [Spirochaetia bacterium]